jgi:RNAse (barnase) inhibitor barstar
MREPLKPYSSFDRFNYVCLIASELLGETSLLRMPALLAGFESVRKTLHPHAVQALLNVRLAGFAPGTLRELKLMADGYRAYHRRLEARRKRGDDVQDKPEQRFSVDDDLNIRKQWQHLTPADVTLALENLTTPLPVRRRALRDVHAADSAAEIDISSGYGGYVSPLGFEPPEPPLYDLSRSGQVPGLVKWEDLVGMANRFDALDVEAGRQGAGDRSWFSRLHDSTGQPTALLLEPSAQGLVPSHGINLTGLKHLIGLPGSGKTTLNYLLAGHLAATGYKACFLMPSIEVATLFIETLGRYQVEVGLLSGQAETSRNRHALNFASSLANQNRGFGVTRPSSRFFATNCALAGFATDEDIPFPHNSPPCGEILQKEAPQKRAKAHRCALCATCGFQFGERELVNTNLWAGHILSIDRSVSRLFSDFDLRHFEFIARTFDVLVIDECDSAQNLLDARGTPLMKLVGDLDSLWSTLIRDIHQPAAGGRNAFVGGETLPTLLEMTGRFGRASERLVGRIMHLPQTFRKANANLLLTSLTIIADMYPDENDSDEESKRHFEIRQTLERLWDTAIKRVAFRLEVVADDDEEGSDLARVFVEIAAVLEVDEATVIDCHTRILEAIELWERDGNDAAIRALASALRSFPKLVSPMGDEDFFASCGLLVSVSLVVLQHFGLAPHLRLMNAEGLVSDGVFESRASRDQLAVLPESLIGRMSGVRYTLSEEGNVDISHVSFQGSPRMLPDRMIQVARDAGGDLAVLLTSATSLLEPSPSFHVSAGPHYVLQRPNAGSGWERSRYKFLPKKDPNDAATPLRFSGAPMARRDSILRSIVDELLRGGQLSDVASAIEENDVAGGVKRKAAFVVNSYDQCELIFRHITASYPAWRGRVRYLTQPSIHGTRDENAVSAAEVEHLGGDNHWDLLIFPMSAIGRGVNIVFQSGPRMNKAMIGSIFFLTRPHPRGDSLELLQGIVGRATEQFDRRSFRSLGEAVEGLRAARRDTVSMAEYLLRMPLVAQSLGRFAEPFVANQMIIILQTIGRAMRGDCPAFVYFVDSAWASNSAKGSPDTARTSMLVMMQEILQKCLSHRDPSQRECYQQLYQTFATPLNSIDGLHRTFQ